MHVFRTDYFLLIAAIASIWICLSAALLTSRTLQNVARHRADPQSPVARHVLRSVSILDQQYEASNAQVSVSEQKFFLTELIDDEVLESVVVMKSNGEIAFLKMEGYGSEGNAVSNSITSIRGSWKYYKKDGTLQMMIERTMMVG